MHPLCATARDLALVHIKLPPSVGDFLGIFGEIIQVLGEMMEIKVINPAKVINNLVEHYRLSEQQEEKSSKPLEQSYLTNT